MRFIDFFSGIGGFRLGMEMAGHECVGHCEIDKYADKSYRAMHNVKESEWFADDIRGIEPGDLPEADVYCGGFPCQAFSIAGKRGGFEDTRGTLFFEVMRLAKVRQPKYLFLENVKGLLSHDRGRTFATILESLWECGYDCQWQVCNSKHFGVPQNRERIFIVGHLRGTSRPKIFPITEGYRSSIVVPRQEVGTIRARYGNDGTGGYILTQHKQSSQRGINCGMYDSVKPKHTDCANALMARDYKGPKNYPMTFVEVETDEIRAVALQNGNMMGRRIKNPGDPAFTVSAGDRHGILMNDNNQRQIIRKLTPKECFRLQGFPDEYFERAASVNSDSQLYKQAGNSVTVNVIYAIARRINAED